MAQSTKNKPFAFHQHTLDKDHKHRRSYMLIKSVVARPAHSNYSGDLRVNSAMSLKIMGLPLYRPAPTCDCSSATADRSICALGAGAGLVMTAASLRRMARRRLPKWRVMARDMRDVYPAVAAGPSAGSKDDATRLSSWK